MIKQLKFVIQKDYCLYAKRLKAVNHIKDYNICHR